MRLETFKGRDVATVHALARKALGDDALILETRACSVDGRPGIEVVAALSQDLERLRRLLRPTRVSGPNGARPRAIALVGPTGAGKTTTLAKLATHPDAFGGRRIGLLTLDTHRAGGVEQLEAYADAAGLSCAQAYDANEVKLALRRFAQCEVVLVDTAGRGPAAAALQARTRDLLGILRPDETHLVVPATLRLDIAERVREAHQVLRPTHALLTKLDEVPADRALGTLTSLLGLPMRWVTDGQDVPLSLHDAPTPIAQAAGLAPRAEAA